MLAIKKPFWIQIMFYFSIYKKSCILLCIEQSATFLCICIISAFGIVFSE